MKKRLHKTSDRMIFGVCGALADYFNLDPTIVRIAFVIAALLYGSGIILYLIMAVIIPNE